MNAFRGIYRIWATILTAAVVVQIFFAGYGAFDTADKSRKDGTVDENSFEDSRSSAHRPRVPDLPRHDRVPPDLLRDA